MLGENPLAGTPAEIADKIGRWRERTGITRLYVQLQDLTDLDQVEPFRGRGGTPSQVATTSRKPSARAIRGRHPVTAGKAEQSGAQLWKSPESA